MKKALDWSEIEMEYIAGAMSYRDLAERYGISVTAVSKHAVKGRWQEKRVAASRGSDGTGKGKRGGGTNAFIPHALRNA